MSVPETPHALLIDDNSTNLEILARMLAAQGITYTLVKDPTQAFDKIETLPRLDVIFCDLEMPKLTGFEMLPMLRERLGGSVPIIAYSVHLSEIDVTRKMGFDGFIGKPLDNDRFPEIISRILKGDAVWELP
ncbi:MAG TPA: response regulator [Aggregatilineales bacterium]|nr:response regulator [Aggregatilineales bacterium]